MSKRHGDVGQYRIETPLAGGGMGEVYLARDLRLDRRVVLKFLRPEILDGAGGEETLCREARRAAAVNHPRLAAVYELGRADDGMPYLALEYVEGESLADRVAREPLAVPEALAVIRQAAEGLAAIHDHGLIHCDLSARNILLGPGGAVTVIDFGLACLTAPAVPNAAENAPTAGPSGTPGCMSPEQVRGEPIDQRTDLFSLGGVLYQTVTGRPPFRRDTVAATLAAVLEDEPPPLAAAGVEAPLELERILRRLLAKNPDRRYPSVKALIGDLDRLSVQMTGRSGIALPAADPSPARGAGRSGGWLAAGAAVLLAVAILDILLLQPQGAEWLRPCLAAVLAAAAGAMSLRRRRAASRLPGALPSDSGFRGLLPFQEADRDRFYGREAETQALLGRLTTPEFRFGVLLGDSGCGKTSLLRAGLLPRLWEKGFVPLYSRSYADPVAAVIESCRRQSQVARQPEEESAAYLERVAAAMEAPLVLVFDQFEEFFIHHEPGPAREPFLRFVADVYHRERLPVKILLSIRSDFLHRIGAEFPDRIPEPLLSGRLFHLHHLSEGQAEEIIRRSSEGAGLPFEAGFCRMLARDLAAGRTVLPSELQIVGEQLQSRRIYTQAGYRRAGGKEALVHGYLEDVIRASGDPAGAALLLRGLISDENTRLTLPVRELAKSAGLARERTDRLLRLFVQSRLLREIQEETPWRYELVHEYLIDQINAVTGRVMDARQRANRLLRQHVADFQLDGRSRIPLGKLWFIQRHADAAGGEKERELIRKSLLRGLGRAAAAAGLILAVVAGLAAVLSVQEEWVSAQFRDGHTAAVRQVLFSPDGRWLFSGAEDGTVRVWDFARRQTRAVLRDHAGWVTSIAVSPDGRYVASGGADRKLVLRDTATLRPVAVWPLVMPCRSVAFTPDGLYVVASIYADDRYETIAWSVSSLRQVFTAPCNLTGALNGIVFWHGTNVVLESNGRLWRIPGGLTKERINMGVGNRNFGQTSFDGSRLLNIDGIGDLWLWDTLSGRLLRRFNGHQDHGRAVAWSPDGRWAASGAEDIAVWDAGNWEKLSRLECSAAVWTLAYSPDSRWLVSGHGDGSILLWDARERERLASFNEHGGPVRAVAFSPDGRSLASSSDDRTVMVWDTASGAKKTVLLDHASRVMSVAFSADGRRLATSDVFGVMMIWDLATRRPWRTYRFDDETWHPGFHMAASPDGRWIADSQRVVDLASGREVLVKTWNRSGDYYGLSFSRDSRWLVGVTHYGEVVRYRCGDWIVLERSQVPEQSLIAVEVTPDSRRLVTGGDDGNIWLWDIEPIRRTALVGRHAARVKALAISPDGRWAASGGDDQTIAIWDIARRRLVGRVGVHTAPVLSLAFSPDGRRLASGEGDNTVRMHTLHRRLWGRPLD